MFVYAGRTYSSRYDKKAPIHIAVHDDETETADRVYGLCHGMEIAPISRGCAGAIEVTCRPCQTEAQRLLFEDAA